MERFSRSVSVNLVLMAAGACAWGFAELSRGEEDAAKPQATGEATFSKEQIEFFEKQILPILKARCLKCHGGEEKIRGSLKLTSRAAVLKGGDQGAAVDLKDPAESLLIQAINYDGLKMPPSGKLPKAEIELLAKWVERGLPWTPEAAVEDEKPKEGSPRVDDEARNYWAYRPLQEPSVPQVKNTNRVQNPIDVFLLEKLEPEGLSLAPPADRVTLIRRAFYDLIGLPPTPEEVDAFLADKRGDAYERLIDNLLARPQYGEKWGRHWLDLVRFAETHGYERDSVKPFAWRYRDYVIDSFNRDKPYDQFLREQLAGDELDVVAAETQIATGYYRLGIWDDEPADRLLAKYDVLDGIVSTTGQVMLGMTVGCARCHDHKKDPIPQRDYYRLLAFFRDVTDMNATNTLNVMSEDDRRERGRLAAERLKREGELYQQLFAIEQRLAKALDEKQRTRFSRQPVSDLVDLKFRFYRDTWQSLPDFDSLKVETEGDLPRNFVTLAAASRRESMGLVFEGNLKVPQAGEYVFSCEATEGVRLIVSGRAVIDQPVGGADQEMASVQLPAGLVPIRVEYFNSDKKPQLKIAWEGPGLARRSLTDEAATADNQQLVADSRIAPQDWAYSFEQPAKEWTAAAFDDGTWKRGPGGFGTAGTPGTVIRTVWDTKDIWLRKKFRVGEIPERIAIDLHHDDEVEVYLNGSLVFESGGNLVAYKRVVLPVEAAQALTPGNNLIAVHCHQTTGGQSIDVGLLSAPERDVLQGLVARQGDGLLGPGTAAKHKALGLQLEALRKQALPEPGLEIMCVAEHGREKTHVLIRGNPGALGDAVEPGFPQVLTSAVPEIHDRSGSQASSGKRRALAEWITAADNPVTPRVMANRIWQFHFGRGIVPTPNDFGNLGEPPTHPELLDWLAREFVSAGWKLKAMHRLIMLSNAYQMSSTATPAGLEKDPGNRLFWRFNMRRLAAEEVRDSILAVSGKLNLKAGGPGVYPPIPKEVLAGQSVPGSGWGNSPPEEASRRSVYVHVKRSLLVPILSQHDMADTDSSCAVRFTTTVPTQALGMINGEFTNVQAEKLAERLEREDQNDLSKQISRGIRLTASRTPGKDEIERDAAFVRKLQNESGMTAHKALTQYCLLLLNANEFVYLD
jgi:hypothetical protein